MSRDIKYIGMDVHREAIVIAVLNGSGELVMETILETKASSILQFIHGLRGELHVTWEEGTWAAWLYDLLQPQVQQVLVCNPRQLWPGTVPRFLRGFAGRGHEAGDGSSDPGAQDRSYYFDPLEERRRFRRRTTENASRLSIELNPCDLPRFSCLGGGQAVRAMLGFEGEYRYTH